MTQLLEKAVERVSALPDSEQDAVAAVILSELEAGQHWDRLFKSSQDVLGRMAREALEEYRAGETVPLDIESDFPKNWSLRQASGGVAAPSRQASQGSV